MEKYEILEMQDIDEYWTSEVSTQSSASKQNKEIALRQFFECVGLKDASEITRSDIKQYINSLKFTRLKPKSKNQKRAHINAFLNYHNRTGLTEFFPKQKVQDNEIQRRDLITRNELNLLLKCAPTLQKKLLVYLLYESGARRGEIGSIRKKDIHIINNAKMIKLWLPESKTTTRNVYLIESVPLFLQYLQTVDLNEDDRIFDWTLDNFNKVINRIGETANKRYSLDKNIHPHLFRHSRFTELVAQYDYNEAELCKLAGWEIGSDMVRVYFHLADEDIERKTLQAYGIEDEREKEEPRFEPIICPDPGCGVRNFHLNEFCYGCGCKLKSDSFEKFEKLKSEKEDIESKVSDLQNIAIKQSERLKRQEQLIDKLISKSHH